MLFFAVALYPEAAPLIEILRLKKDPAFRPADLFTPKDAALILTGCGPAALCVLRLLFPAALRFRIFFVLDGFFCRRMHARAHMPHGSFYVARLLSRDALSCNRNHVKALRKKRLAASVRAPYYPLCTVSFNRAAELLARSYAKPRVAELVGKIIYDHFPRRCKLSLAVKP